MTRTIRERLMLMAAAALLCGPALGLEARAEQPDAPEPAIQAGPAWLGLIADRTWEGEGVRAAQILRGSPVDKAGLREGDVVVGANGEPLATVRALKKIMRQQRAGDALTLTIKRASEPAREVALTLAAIPTQRQLLTMQLMGRPAPNFSLQLLPGEEIAGVKSGELLSLKALKGKPVVLEFWATWCGPCKAYADALQQTKARHGTAIHAVAISAEERAVLLKHLEEHGEQRAYTSARDAGGIMHEAYFVRAFPLVIVLDADLRVRKIITGTDPPELIEKAVESLLKP